MQRYELASGVFFTLLALVQLTRVAMRWPVQVNGLQIPIWVSGVAFLIAGAFAVWAFRTAAHDSRPG
jgi:hypothetical protein